MTILILLFLICSITAARAERDHGKIGLVSEHAASHVDGESNQDRGSFVSLDQTSKKTNLQCRCNKLLCRQAGKEDCAIMRKGGVTEQILKQTGYSKSECSDKDFCKQLLEEVTRVINKLEELSKVSCQFIYDNKLEPGDNALIGEDSIWKDCKIAPAEKFEEFDIRTALQNPDLSFDGCEKKVKELGELQCTYYDNYDWDDGEHSGALQWFKKQQTAWEGAAPAGINSRDPNFLPGCTTARNVHMPPGEITNEHLERVGCVKECRCEKCDPWQNQDLASMKELQLTVGTARGILAEVMNTLDLGSLTLQEVKQHVNDKVDAIFTKNKLPNSNVLAFAVMLAQGDMYIEDEGIHSHLMEIKKALSLAEISEYPADEGETQVRICRSCRGPCGGGGPKSDRKCGPCTDKVGNGRECHTLKPLVGEVFGGLEFHECGKAPDKESPSPMAH